MKVKLSEYLIVNTDVMHIIITRTEYQAHLVSC